MCFGTSQNVQDAGFNADWIAKLLTGNLYSETQKIEMITADFCLRGGGGV